MMSHRPVGTVFREGGELVPVCGTFQGAVGIFVGLKPDVNWAKPGPRRNVDPVAAIVGTAAARVKSRR
jgi:hypothetical protein